MRKRDTLVSTRHCSVPPSNGGRLCQSPSLAGSGVAHGPTFSTGRDVRFGQLWRYNTNALPARHAKLDAEIDASSQSLGKTSITPDDHVMASRYHRNADYEEDLENTHLDASTRTLVNPEALELATRLTSIEQERAGLSFKKGSALRFPLKGSGAFHRSCRCRSEQAGI